MYTNHAHGAMRKNSHAIEKSPRVSKVKSLCTREFAVDGQVYLRTFVRIMGRDLGSVAADPPSLCVTASAYVRALIGYRNPTCYASQKKL